jgi:hypothetical protein
MRSVEASLDEILSLGLCHKMLEFSGSKRIDETGFGHDKEGDE